jgi:hypothetical protein
MLRAGVVDVLVVDEGNAYAVLDPPTADRMQARISHDFMSVGESR